MRLTWSRVPIVGKSVGDDGSFLCTTIAIVVSLIVGASIKAELFIF